MPPETFTPEFRREKLLNLLRRSGPLTVTQIWDQLPLYAGGDAPLILGDLRALGRSVRKIDGFWRGNNKSPYWGDSWTSKRRTSDV
jgi:hypothetical protein